jgi:hypothetical protein
MRLPDTLADWGTPRFESTLKAELALLGPTELPLQAGLRASSQVAASPPEAILLRCEEYRDGLRIEAGVFYTGIIAGCSCADDPTPVDEQTEYCRVLLEIERPHGHTRIRLLEDDAAFD